MCDYVITLLCEWVYEHVSLRHNIQKQKTKKRPENQNVSLALSLAHRFLSLVSFRIVSSSHHDIMMVSQMSKSINEVNHRSAPQLLYKCIIYDGYRDDIMTHRSAPLRCSPLRCVRVSPAGDNHNGHQCAYHTSQRQNA